MPKNAKKAGLWGWEAAAARARAPVGDFKIWVAEHTSWSGDRWSKWNSGAEPIPADFVIDYLLAQLEEARRTNAGRSRVDRPG